MKILHIITGLADGGAEAAMYRLIAHDLSNQHYVVSLTGEGKYGPMLMEIRAKVVTLNMPRQWLTIEGLKHLWRILKSIQPDVVQTWMYHANLVGGIIAYMTGVPVVWGIHNSTLAPGQIAYATIVVARVCGPLSRVVPSRIVACARRAAEVHASLGYDAGRMVVIPNGYDLARFAPDMEARARLRNEWNVTDDTPLLGMVARFDPLKDHNNLLRALALLRAQGTAFQMILIGTKVDRDNKALQAQIATANLSKEVRLIGPRRDIPAVMNALDIHVLSSRAEAFPNVLAEAMACGTPCVATDVGDAALIVGDTGWIVPPRSPEALAQGLGAALTAWQDRSGWTERQRRARQRIEEHFAIASMVERYREVWQDVFIERVSDEQQANRYANAFCFWQKLGELRKKDHRSRNH